MNKYNPQQLAMMKLIKRWSNAIAVIDNLQNLNKSEKKLLKEMYRSKIKVVEEIAELAMMITAFPEKGLVQ
jgi:phosphoketolase